MDKILFSERLREQRKKCGYPTIADLAKKYNDTFPSKRNGRKDENIGDYKGILGTLKNYENPNKECSPGLDIVNNLCKLLQCNVDYLLGNIDCETHDHQFIHDTIGLSEDSIQILSTHYIKYTKRCVKALDVLIHDIDNESGIKKTRSFLDVLSNYFNFHPSNDKKYAISQNGDIIFDPKPIIDPIGNTAFYPAGRVYFTSKQLEQM